MREHFQIDLRHQFKSAKVVFIGFIWIMTSMTIGHFFIQDSKLIEALIFGFLFWMVTSVAMALPFHIQYLMANWKTKLIVDKELMMIEILQSGKSYNYKFSDLTIHRHILGHYRPDRTKSWTPIPFDYYGYIQIKTNDNKEIYITSLMIDPFNPPLQIDKTEYRFPFIVRPS